MSTSTPADGHTPGPFQVAVQRRRYCVRTVTAGEGELLAQHIERAPDAYLFAMAPGLLARAEAAESVLRQLSTSSIARHHLSPHLLAAIDRVLGETPWRDSRGGWHLPSEKPEPPSAAAPSAFYCGICGTRERGKHKKQLHLVSDPPCAASCGNHVPGRVPRGAKCEECDPKGTTRRWRQPKDEPLP